jgi:glucose/arabinose dehydrogenase
MVVAQFAFLVLVAGCADPPSEADYYPITSFQPPEGVVLEVGGFQLMPDGKLAACTRRGEIWMIERPFDSMVGPSQFKRFAEGLHEPLSLAESDGKLYVVQRGEVTRLGDENHDGIADRFDVINAGWGLSGDYHEYAFGSKFDKNGDMWIVLCLTGSYTSEAPFRGWCVRVNKSGTMTPTASGVRSPGGIGANGEGDIFYTDNQGPWNGTCGLKHLKPGAFVGHPGGFRWYDRAGLGKAPKEPQNPSRFAVEAKRIPEYIPAAILFPYNKMGQSAAGVAVDHSNGKFGPFAGQLFVGDQTHSTVMRCFLEKVKGRYQGACFPFRSGFGAGCVGMEFSSNGHLFVGETARGWGSRGTKQHGIERLNWTGKIPFEIHSIKANADGFTLRFTIPVDPKTASNPVSYNVSTYTYIFRAEYGSPEVDHTKPTITRIVVSDDGLSARLFLDRLQQGHVHEIVANGIRNRSGLPLLHPQAYYTLNEIPN